MKTWLMILVIAGLSLSIRDGGAQSSRDELENSPWNKKDKAAWINHTAVEHPWRIQGGLTCFVPRAEGWYQIHAKVVQIDKDGVLMDAWFTRGNGLSDTQLIWVSNSPGGFVDGDKLKPFVAKLVGAHTYTTVLGGSKTVRAFDFGLPTSAPQVGKDISK